MDNNKEYTYVYNGNDYTLNELKPLIIHDFITTDILKKDLKKKYPVSVVKIVKILKDIKKPKKCLVCGETDETNFYEKDRICCKTCVLEKAKNKYDNLSDIDKRYVLSRQTKWVTNNMVKFRVLAAKHRAKKKNLEFDINEEFIFDLLEKQNFKCKYSGIKLDINKIGSDTKKFININALSIDRINSNKGYVKDNVVLVTAIVNTMKNELSEEEFLSVVKEICYYNERNLMSKI